MAVKLPKGWNEDLEKARASLAGLTGALGEEHMPKDEFEAMKLATQLKNLGVEENIQGMLGDIVKGHRMETFVNQGLLDPAELYMAFDEFQDVSAWPMMMSGGGSYMDMPATEYNFPAPDLELAGPQEQLMFEPDVVTRGISPQELADLYLDEMPLEYTHPVPDLRLGDR